MRALPLRRDQSKLPTGWKLVLTAATLLIGARLRRLSRRRLVVTSTARPVRMSSSGEGYRRSVLGTELAEWIVCASDRTHSDDEARAQISSLVASEPITGDKPAKYRTFSTTPHYLLSAHSQQGKERSSPQEPLYPHSDSRVVGMAGFVGNSPAPRFTASISITDTSHYAGRLSAACFNSLMPDLLVSRLIQISFRSPSKIVSIWIPLSGARFPQISSCPGCAIL